jgi:disulfide bond formation protein DsbB
MKGDAAAGKTKFDSTCVSCHGPDAKGIPGLGKDMTTSTFIKSTGDDALVAFITKGRPASDPANTTKVDMPPKGGNPSFSEKDLYDVVAFLRTLNK